MTGLVRRTGRRVLCIASGSLVAAVVLSGCEAGGFGSDEPTGPDRTIRSYAALGDGFTAAPYVGQSADDDCKRSADNYPALVADQLDIAEVRDVSCTGAETEALTTRTRPTKRADPLPAQIDAVDRDTDLVTIGIGIEDDDLLHGIFTICTTPPYCSGAIAIQEVLSQIEQLGGALVAAVRTIQEKAPSAYIVLVGYPRIAPPEGTCKDLPEMDDLGLDSANYLLDRINQRVESVARQAGAAYLDAAALSADHELCSAEPWTHGRTGEPGESVAFHPVAAEQRAVADQLVTLIETR